MGAVTRAGGGGAVNAVGVATACGVGASGAAMGSGGGAKPSVIYVDGANDAYRRGLAGAMGGLALDSKAAASTGDDLLDMMDAA